MGSLFGGGQKVQKTKQELPWWLESGSKKAVQMGKDIADRPYEVYTGQRIVGPSNNEQAGYLAAGNMRGSYQPYLDQSDSFLAQAGRSFADADLSGYVNPYTESVLNQSANKLTESFEQQRNARNLNAAASGAYGGMRSVLADQNAEDNYLDSVGDLYTSGLASAWNQGADRWDADRANDANVASQYGSLANLAGGLRGNEVSTLLGAGQAERGIGQSQADFDYSQFLEERDWDISNLQPLLAAVGKVPYAKQQSTTQGYNASDGEKAASAIGTAASIASLFMGSSRDFKTDNAPLQGSVLEGIARMPVESWRYKGDTARHVGPYAEDAQRELGIGDGKTIPLIDAIGTQYAGLNEAAKRIRALEEKTGSGGPEPEQASVGSIGQMAGDGQLNAPGPNRQQATMSALESMAGAGMDNLGDYGEQQGSVLAQMRGLLPGPEGYERPQLDRNDKARVLRSFGLNMMRATEPGGGGLFASIGNAGQAAQQEADAISDRKLKAHMLGDEAEQGFLKQVYDHLGTERDTAADRQDERFDRLNDVVDAQTSREEAASRGQYRDNRVDIMRQNAQADRQMDAVRAENIQARTAATRAGIGRGTATDREIQSLIARGVDPAWAEDVARGNVDVSTDQFGNTRAVNMATGETRDLGRGGARQGAPSALENASPTAPQTSDGQAAGGDGRTLFNDLAEGTGPVAGARAAVNAVIGPFVEGAPFEDTDRARASIRNFAQDAKTALVNNPRFPVAEQEVVANLLPNADRFWTDPDSERTRLRELRRFLENKQTQNTASMNSGRVTEDEAGKLSNQNESINRVLGLMGQPGGSQQAAQAPGSSLPAGVPQGSHQIGTLDGKAVYEAPDGRRLVAE